MMSNKEMTFIRIMKKIHVGSRIQREGKYYIVDEIIPCEDKKTSGCSECEYCVGRIITKPDIDKHIHNLLNSCLVFIKWGLDFKLLEEDLLTKDDFKV